MVQSGSIISDDIQFSKYVEVVFTNFDSGAVTGINSDFLKDNKPVASGLRISFEYTKNDDEGYNTPNGSIVIYGLKRETFRKLGERMRAEVSLKFGYLMSKYNYPQELFYAVLMNKKYEVKDGISVSTFEVLGDFAKINADIKYSKSLPRATIAEVILHIASSLNKTVKFRIPEEYDRNSLADLFIEYNIAPYGYSFAQTPQDEMNRLRDSFGLKFQIEKDALNISILPQAVDMLTDLARQHSEYKAKVAKSTLVAENKTASDVVEVYKTKDNQGRKIDFSATHSLYLSPNTGLLGTPVDTTVIDITDYDTPLAQGEEVWQRKNQKVLVDKDGKARVDKDTGEVKLSKKAKTKKVARRTCIAKALINSRITFNTMVTIEIGDPVLDRTYWVRSAKFVGDSQADVESYMELELNE